MKKQVDYRNFDKKDDFSSIQSQGAREFRASGQCLVCFLFPHVNVQCCGQARHSMKPREVVHGALPEQARTKPSPEGDLGRWHVYFRCGRHIGWSPYPNFRTIFHCLAL